MIAIDTNILVYSLDESDPAKHAAAVACLTRLRTSGETPVLLWQAACETRSWGRRRKSEGVLSDEEISAKFQSVLDAYPLTFPSKGVLELSFELQSRHSLSHWDSLLISACIAAGVDTIYSEDMSHGVTYESVTVVNLFFAA